MKEETILFPLIHTLEKTTFDSESRFKMPVENPIHVMEFEHEEVGNLFKELREITNGFTPPEYACNTWRVLYAKLNEFEEDLFTHIHLENNILFPKAIQLEKNKGETAFQ